MRSLVWLRVAQGSWVCSEGGKDYPTIFVIANFILVALELGISNNLVVLDNLPERWDQTMPRFCRQARETRFNGKFEM